MDKISIKFVIGITILFISFFLGNPLEFVNSKLDSISNIIFCSLMFYVLYKLFKMVLNITNKFHKWLNIISFIVLSIPYILNQTYTLLTTWNFNHKMWQDTAVYNKDNEIIYAQFRETSGSLWDYRNRRIIFEAKQFRISYDYPEKCIKKENWKLVKKFKIK